MPTYTLEAHRDDCACERCTHVDALAQVGFNARRESCAGLTHDFRPIPKWEDAPDAERENWRRAALAIYTASLNS